MSARGGTALFSGGGSRNTNASKALVEFRAGKMTMSGNLVSPDKRRGQIIVEQGDDQLMHFKWKDRSTGQIEDDLIIIPDDVEFKKVAQCTTGRVFLLKFKSSTKRMFFWMQEPKDDKDEDYCKKVNDFLNNPPAPGSSGSRGGSGGGGSGIPGLDLSNLGDSELQSLLNNMSQQQLMQLFGGSGGLSALTGGSGSSRQRSTARTSSNAPTSSSGSSSTTATATPASTTASASSAGKATEGGSSSAIRLADLQNVLSGMPAAAAGSSSSGGPMVDLSTGMSAEVLQPLLENPEFVKKMKELLPDEEQKVDDATGEVKETLQSPQFRQAMGMFSTGLQTGQLAPLIREFNLGEAAIEAATKGDMEAFVKALQNQKKDAVKSTGDDQEDMALD